MMLLLCLLVAAPRPLTDQDRKAGRAVFVRECSACHGERGDGNGAGAPFVDPKPRNFTRKMFKLRTTPTGEPPATADILHTIENGIPGSAMPSSSASVAAAGPSPFPPAPWQAAQPCASYT